jgi:phosphopantothenoylcysteine decarboxylase/phosphopantothenate--cysteine ligase
MNGAMYEHPATQANLARLRERGARVLEPGTGSLASLGEYGTGRLPEPPELLAAFEAAVAGADDLAALAAAGDEPRTRDLDGLNVLVTAGGTREPIDAVRYVGNRSSGRMGFALADEAARRGAAVTVVAAGVSLPRRAGITYVEVETAAEMAAACEQRFDDCDVLLMAAAVADYRPAEPYAGKLKKDRAGEELPLRLVRTTDVLATLAAGRRPDQLLVGFAAEHGDDAVAYGREKLARKGLDAVVVNDIGTPGVGFDSPDNEVTIVTADAEQRIPRASKPAIAAAILDMLLSRRSSPKIKVPR